MVLFGSGYSKQSSALQKQFTESAIDIIRPDPKDIRVIDTLRQRIYANKETAQNIDTFNALLKHYGELAPVVIACTELSIVLRNITSDTYDMARIQINQALHRIV